MRGAAILLLMCACGRISFDARTDARFDGSSTDDGELGVFSTPVPLTILNSAVEDDDPTLTSDELEIFFQSSRPGSQGPDIWHSQRASTADAWQPPTNVTELNTAGNDETPELTADGLTMFFARGPNGSGNDEIYVTTRAARGQPWSTPVLVSELVSANDDTAPATSPDQLTMIFTRGSVTIDAKLLLTTRGSVTDPWATPVAVLDAAGQQEDQAWFDDKEIYFTVNTPGLQTIYRAARVGAAGFGPLVAVPEIDMPGDESDPWLSPSKRTIVFEHQDDLYISTR